MNLKTITGPSTEPVTLAEAKLHLRVDHADEDTLITQHIKAARISLEQECRRAFITQTLELRLNAFPARSFVLPRPPLQAVTAIKYVDKDGVETTVSSTTYGVDTNAEPGIVYLKSDYYWPSVTLLPVGGFRVTYTAGWAAAANVPDTIKNAILLMVGTFYENREEVVISAGLTRIALLAVDRLIASERIRGF
jgi:uncharacterized phiE125 gp8 family phage protein